MNHKAEGVEAPFDMAELKEAERKLPSGMTPGSDGIFNKMLSMEVRFNPVSLLDVYISCLMAGVFPKAWKTVVICLLFKGAELVQPYLAVGRSRESVRESSLKSCRSCYRFGIVPKSIWIPLGLQDC